MQGGEGTEGELEVREPDLRGGVDAAKERESGVAERPLDQRERTDEQDVGEGEAGGRE
jgi:hypothetical protein